MNGKKVLITGGRGMLGRALIPKLKKLGYECVVITRKGGSGVVCDVRDYGQVCDIMTKHRPDIVIHLAGITGNLACETGVQNAIATNVMGTYNILESSVKNKPKIILASTREVYKETDELLGESSALDPKNINGATKMFSESLVRDFHARYGMPFVILRFSNFLGEDNEKNGISAMIKNAIQKNKIAMFGGRQEIDLLHYSDAANSILKSLEYSKSDTFNIAGNNPIKVMELVKKIEKKIGRKLKITKSRQREFESTYCRLDTNRANRLLKFMPTNNIDVILDKMISRWSEI